MVYSDSSQILTALVSNITLGYVVELTLFQ